MMKKYDDLKPGDTFPYKLDRSRTLWVTMIKKDGSAVVTATHSKTQGWSLYDGQRKALKKLGLKDFTQGWNLNKLDYEKHITHLINNHHLIDEPLLNTHNLNILSNAS